MHYLLARQIKRVFGDKFKSSPKLEVFLKAISNTYDNYDKDRKFLEHSFDLSSKEFLELHHKVLKLLREQKAEKESVEQKIIERTQELQEAKAVLEIKVEARTRELKEIADSLDEQVKERTKELEEKMADLKKFQKLSVGRELKMIELKKEVKKIKGAK
ncbi:hypothetical protein KJ866_03820 [Patescibacteria group bacterium]|nr:hypothetical protein [Patescibacteria group bacterium]MBU2219578.1 hypothetical protein [Patescibacteria group bacterium]MBU2265304.1 hypothetical protein [Patescibacteria group bacterium]